MVMVIMFPGPKAGGTFTGPRHPPTRAGKALARWKFSSDVAGSRLKPTLPKDLVQSDEETLLALSDSRGKLRRRAGSRAEVRAVQEVCLQGSGGGHFAQDSCPPASFSSSCSLGPCGMPPPKAGSDCRHSHDPPSHTGGEGGSQRTGVGGREGRKGRGAKCLQCIVGVSVNVALAPGITRAKAIRGRHPRHNGKHRLGPAALTGSPFR